MTRKLEAVVCDLDGSLLNSRKTVSEEDRKTIQTLKKKGVRFHIISGRPHPFSRQIAEDTGFDSPVSCCNGAYIYDFQKDEVLFHTALIDLEDVLAIRDYCKEHGISYLLYSLEGVIFDRPDSRRCLNWKKQNDTVFKEGNKISFVYDCDGPDLSDLHFVKLLIPYVTEEEIEGIRERFDKDDKYEFVLSEKAVLDINTKGIHKGFALKTLSERYGFSLENTLALGDNFNDVEMLEEAGYPIVPENGEEEVKEKACFITADNDHDPLTHAIRKLFPELL
ncbi:MAG: HAD family phosphatase [Erysipelotrichaceae bacterium]|nr:HAD family phosphatase [Erysipelotrichaceae bacterium]